MINLIVSESERSLIYLREILKNKIKINKIILYSKQNKTVYKYLKKKKLIYLLNVCKSNDINSKIINNILENEKKYYNIISTYPGEIVKNPNILKKKLLHLHPGDLPKFKGSTTIYYSIILKKKICVTLFQITNIVDDGKIIYKKYFKNPKNLNSIEKNFDNKIRALTLIDYLNNQKFNYKQKKIKKNYLPYYIAHPIIRQIVINKKNLIN